MYSDWYSSIRLLCDNKHSYNINPKQNLHQQITQTQIWKLIIERLVLPNLYLLEDEIKRFVLFFLAEIAKIITKTISMFYPTMSPIYVMITYPRSRTGKAVFVLTFLDTVFSDMFFWISIRLMMWICGRKLYDQPKNQGVKTHANQNRYKQQKKTTSNKKITSEE